jgi:hypothetical protein
LIEDANPYYLPRWGREKKGVSVHLIESEPHRISIKEKRKWFAAIEIEGLGLYDVSFFNRFL